MINFIRRFLRFQCKSREEQCTSKFFIAHDNGWSYCQFIEDHWGWHKDFYGRKWTTDKRI